MHHLSCLVQGIALSADPNYKVLGAAYPWIARRLLTEQSIELLDTLCTLFYKKGRFQVRSQICFRDLAFKSLQRPDQVVCFLLATKQSIVLQDTLHNLVAQAERTRL